MTLLPHPKNLPCESHTSAFQSLQTSCLPATATSSVIGPVGSVVQLSEQLAWQTCFKSSLVLGPTQNRKLFESLGKWVCVASKIQRTTMQDGADTAICPSHWKRYHNMPQWNFIKVFVEFISLTLLRCYLNMPEVCSPGSIIIISSMKWTSTVSYGMERWSCPYGLDCGTGLESFYSPKIEQWRYITGLASWK